MFFKNTNAVECWFSGAKFDKSGTITPLTGKFKNTILTAGMLKLYENSVSEMTTFINIGTGDTIPANDQTGLVSHAFASNNVVDTKALFNEDPKPNLKITKIFRFDIGTCTGEFKEVALSKASNADYLNRQLFKNANSEIITIEVAEDEGLLLTAEIKIFLDPNIALIGEEVTLDLKGAVGGNFTLNVEGGTESALITYEQFSVGTTEIEAEVKKLIDPDLVVNVTGTLAAGFVIKFLPLAGQSTLVIGSNNLVGNTEDPTISITTANPKLPITFNLSDIDAGTTTVMKMHRSYPMDSSNSVWGMSEVNNPIYVSSLDEWSYEINGKTPTNVQRTPPAEGTAEVTDVCIWGPGRISSDATFKFHTILVKLGTRVIYEYRFVNDVTILNTEEIKFTFKRGWGRWADLG